MPAVSTAECTCLSLSSPSSTPPLLRAQPASHLSELSQHSLSLSFPLSELSLSLFLPAHSPDSLLCLFLFLFALRVLMVKTLWLSLTLSYSLLLSLTLSFSLFLATLSPAVCLFTCLSVLPVFSFLSSNFLSPRLSRFLSSSYGKTRNKS